MARFGEIFNDLVIETLKQVHQYALESGPMIALALIILLIGWISAVLIKKIVSKLLKALGFDVVTEKVGIKKFLENGGVTRNPSSVIGLGFYWLILLSTLIMVFNALNLESVSLFIRQIVLYLPKIVIALVLLMLGMFLGRFVGTFVETTSRLARMPFSSGLGKTARYVIIGLALLLILEQLDVPTAIVIQSFGVIFVVVPLVLLLLFLVGGRDIVCSMLAKRFLVKEYRSGDKIEFDSVSGEIESIDLTTTKLKSNKGEFIIPNSELAKKIIRRKNT